MCHINHITRHLQNINKCLQIFKHAPTFKSPPPRQCALHPSCFVCRCRCPCAAPPVEQRVHLPHPHQSCSLTCPGQCPTWPHGHPEVWCIPCAAPCSGTRALCCWRCCGVMAASAPTRSLLLPLHQLIYLGSLCHSMVIDESG